MRTKKTTLEKYFFFGMNTELTLIRSGKGLFSLETTTDKEGFEKKDITDVSLKDALYHLGISIEDIKEFEALGGYRTNELSVPFLRLHNLKNKGGIYELEEYHKITKESKRENRKKLEECKDRIIKELQTDIDRLISL